ncbi:substrate-binding domain-containing protein [Streptomyces sp. HB-N217]|uniref:substrate-binding domain-containing protein n=1 Tax=Streptomyces sp. HB-N217 TaxID=2792016 RepID=UPI0035A82DF0
MACPAQPGVSVHVVHANLARWHRAAGPHGVVPGLAAGPFPRGFGRLDGVRGAGRLAVTGYYDIDAASMVSPALTTVVDPAREIGRSVARLLIDRLDGAGGAREVVLTHRLVRHASA